MTAVLIGQTASILKNLNADLSVTTTASSEAVATTCGTYALINDLISNLSSLKASLKAAEKKIESALQEELVTGTADSTTNATNTFNVSAATTILGTVPLGVPTLESVGDAVSIAGDTAALHTARRVDADHTKNVGIQLGSAYYTETGIFHILSEAWYLVQKLKNGVAVPVTVATTVAVS